MAYDSAPASQGSGAVTRNCRSLPPFAALKAFEAFGRLGGIRRAACDLGLDHAVISRHLRSLEAWTGTPLIDRGLGGGRLTIQGQHYHARIAAAIDQVAAATHDLMRQEEERRLVVWCVPGFASQWLSHQLAAFGVAYPDIDVELRPTDGSPDLLRHEADIDIRYFGDAWSPPPSDRHLRCTEMARPRVLAVASPELVARLGMKDSPAEILHGPLLHEEHDEQWKAWFAARGVAAPDRLPGPRMWHAHLALGAARSGKGIALASTFLLGDDLATGRLVEVAAPAAPSDEVVLGAYSFVAREDRWQRPTMIQLRRWLQAAADADLGVAA